MSQIFTGFVPGTIPGTNPGSSQDQPEKKVYVYVPFSCPRVGTRTPLHKLPPVKTAFWFLPARKRKGSEISGKISERFSGRRKRRPAKGVRSQIVHFWSLFLSLFPASVTFFAKLFAGLFFARKIGGQKTGSCLSRTPSRQKCLCLLGFSCPKKTCAVHPGFAEVPEELGAADPRIRSKGAMNHASPGTHRT